MAAGEDKYNPKVLPRRFMDDEASERIYSLGSPEFRDAFDKAAARWLSRDCHRSQYGYPFRVAIELALENRHRSVTLASFACSGAEVTEGLFLEMDPREGASGIPGGKVRAQLDQLSDLLCRGAPSQSASYMLPIYGRGRTQITARQIVKTWCAPEQRRRPVDVLLLSIGGNDVGFGALAAYALTERVSDLAPIAGLAGGSTRFGPQVSRVYLNVLDERMKALKDALHEGFGVAPARVVQTSYEPLQYDETGALCGAQPTLGMDVHPGLGLSRQRLQRPPTSCRIFWCGSNASPAAGALRLPRQSRNRRRHRVYAGDRAYCRIPQARDMCARSQASNRRRLAMRMPRVPLNGDEFKPYSPAATLPYAHRWRLFRTPNDAFLTANTHREGSSPVRYPAACLCRALQRRDPSDSRGPCDRRRSRRSSHARNRGQARSRAG